MKTIDRVLDLLDQAEKMMDKGGARVRVLEAIRLLTEHTPSSDAAVRERAA